MTQAKQYRNTATGELVPAHRLGVDEDGRAIYAAVEGFEPTFTCEVDEDGNWLAAEPMATAKATGYAVECDLAGARVVMHAECYTNHCVIYEIPSEGNPDNAVTKRVVADADGDRGAITAGWRCDHCNDPIMGAAGAVEG